MNTHSRNLFDDDYPIREGDFEQVELEIEKLQARIKGLSSILTEIKANSNNLRAHVDFVHAPVHGQANETYINMMNSIRDVRLKLLPVEEEVRKARKGSRLSSSLYMKKGK